MSIKQIPIYSKSELDQVFEGELFQEWEDGNPTLLRVQPEHVDSRIEKAAESIIVNNGSYESGDNVVFHARPFALDLAVEMGNLLEEKVIIHALYIIMLEILP